MSLKFEVEDISSIDESMRDMYKPYEGKYRLQVDGIDDASELKEALRKEREERAAAKAKLKEIEDASSIADQKRLEEKQEFETLWKAEQEKGTATAKELDDLRSSIAQKDRNSEAYKIVSTLATDTARAEILQQQALGFIHHTPEGIKINGPDGEAWDAAKLTAHLKEKYPFLVDGSKASGGGATGGGTGGGAAKKFNEYTGAELVAIRKESPETYDQLKKAHYG